jgi:ABC-2 type transport system permease protein
MTAPATTFEGTPDEGAPDDPPMVTLDTTRSIPAGWRVIGSREFTEHLLSVRFIALLLVLGLAGLLAIYAVAGTFRDVASEIARQTTVTGQQIPVFTLLFTTSPAIPGISGQSFPSFAGLVALLGPVLGIAFGFDAISSERSEGTLPRLVSQPIHRDDVINGKFVAGLAVIGLVLVSVITLIGAFGIIRLGIVPHAQEVLRLIAWVAVTFLYVGLWLAFGLLLSVLIRRAATAALIGFGVWLLVSIFGGLITTIATGLIQPAAGAGVDELIGNAQIQQFVSRLMPSTLYQEISLVILNPSVTQVSAPTTIGQIQQGQQQIDPSLVYLSLDQSLLLVWPQIVALIALTVVCFAAAYVSFMRQEVRA